MTPTEHDFGVIGDAIGRQLLLYSQMARMPFRKNDLEMAARAAMSAAGFHANAATERERDAAAKVVPCDCGKFAIDRGRLVDGHARGCQQERVAAALAEAKAEARREADGLRAALCDFAITDDLDPNGYILKLCMICEGFAREAKNIVHKDTCALAGESRDG